MRSGQCLTCLSDILIVLITEDLIDGSNWETRKFVKNVLQCLTLSTVGNTFSRRHIEIRFLFFPENRF